VFFGDAITLSYIISDFGELRRLGGSKVEVKNIAFFAELPGNVAGFHREGWTSAFDRTSREASRSEIVV